MPKSNSVLCAAATGLLLTVEAQAQRPDEVRFYAENDFFNPFTEQTDRYYTQGMRLDLVWSQRGPDANFLPGLTHRTWCSLMCGEGAEKGAVRSGYAIGQNMYTPADIGIAAPQPYDRPWAGLLYASRIASVSYEEPSLKAQRQDRIEATIGIVGPAALAGETQILWHDIWGFTPPRGWDNQLRNEPVLQLRYDSALRWPREERVNADIIPRIRGNLGNALTSIEADVTGRIGWNLSGFGISPIPLAPPPASATAARRGQANGLSGAGWLPSFNLFARLGLKAVGHNIFLDGNSVADNDIRIDRRTFVAEAAGGFEANLVGPWWLTFQFVRRGSEFETWRGRKAPAQDFGAVTIAWVPSG